MIQFTVNKTAFQFTYLQDYATFLLNNKLEEFVRVNIRFGREADLPLLKPLSKLSEEEIIQLSMGSSREMLKALSSGTISDQIRENASKWINNSIIVDKDEITAEDLTLLFYLRRKIFTFFLDSYTKNVVLQKFIIAEVDSFSTQEELISLNIYLKMQQEKLARVNSDLAFHRELLLEAQTFGGLGTFLIDFKDQSKSIFTEEYKRIFEMDSVVAFEEFFESVHADDKQTLHSSITDAYKNGGNFEVEYRFKKNGPEKRIWSKGMIVSESDKPVLIRGIVKEISAS